MTVPKRGHTGGPGPTQEEEVRTQNARWGVCRRTAWSGRSRRGSLPFDPWVWASSLQREGLGRSAL